MVSNQSPQQALDDNAKITKEYLDEVAKQMRHAGGMAEDDRRILLKRVKEMQNWVLEPADRESLSRYRRQLSKTITWKWWEFWGC